MFQDQNLRCFGICEGGSHLALGYYSAFNNTALSAILVMLPSCVYMFMEI